MALLQQVDLTAIQRDLCGEWSRDREGVAGVTRAELAAAVTAADTWANTNASSYNSALPLPARTSLTATQKAKLLVYVIRKRWELGV